MWPVQTQSIPTARRMSAGGRTGVQQSVGAQRGTSLAVLHVGVAVRQITLLPVVDHQRFQSGRTSRVARRQSTRTLFANQQEAAALTKMPRCANRYKRQASRRRRNNQRAARHVRPDSRGTLSCRLCRDRRDCQQPWLRTPSCTRLPWSCHTTQYPGSGTPSNWY
jgi:hypothetical protein